KSGWHLQNKRTSEGLSPIGTQCEPMGLKPYMGKERFCGTDTTKSLLIYQRTEPCLDKECLEVSPDSQHNSGIVILVGKVFLLNQSMHRLNRFLCSAFIQAICQFILGEGPVYSVAYQQDLVAGQQGNRILIPLY